MLSRSVTDAVSQRLRAVSPRQSARADVTDAADMVVTRFAPSPTGWLHLGHVHAAWTAWQAARAAGGRFLLRLEDIDGARCRPAFADGIMADLAWLGLHWDGPVRRQSEHLAEYRAVLADLAGRSLAYPCFCSRAEIARELAASAAAPHAAPHAPDGAARYPGTCRALGPAARAARLAAGAPHAWRLDMAAALAAARVQGGLGRFRDADTMVAADPVPFGDVVLGRRDAPASYHLCVTHDDAVQGVTLVTRAEDLRPATHLHVLLQVLMGWPTPFYGHHPLLLDDAGRRLAKRDGAAAVRALREGGHSAAEVLALAGAQPAAAV